MFFIRIILMALRSLLVHPLRTFLATLGVLIGVGAVVAAMAILEGMSSKMRTAFESMGSNKLFVQPLVQRRANRVVGSIDSLKLEDAEAVAKECPTIRRSMPQVSSGGTVKYFSKNTNCNILGATDIYPDINNHHVSEGEFLKKADIQGQTSVAVLGFKVKRDLFGGRPAIGEKVKIITPLGSKIMTVVGVMEEKGNVGFTPVDEQVIIPITTAMDKIYGMKFIAAIIAEAATPSDADIEKAKAEIKRVLRQRHRVRAGKQDDFQVQSQKEMVQQVGSITDIVGVVLLSIAGISLVVGGTGIMNIMLVSVTERTREIGVRMAMGAQRADVLKQFLVEASIVSFLGGAVGVIMGWGLANTIERVTRVVEVITTTGSVVLALSMATVVGIISGIYPAWKASRLDPVEALRYE